MPSKRLATSMFCDDIRQEIGNKISLMGIYTAGDIIFPAAPPAALSVCVVVWITSDIDDPIQQLAVRALLQPEEIELVRIETEQTAVSAPSSPNATRMTISTIFRIPPAPIHKEGYLEVFVDTEREKDIRAGRLLLRFPPLDNPPTTK